VTRRIPGLRFSVAVGVVVALVGIGSGVGVAAWTGATTKGAAITAATAATSATGIAGLAATYKPGLPGVSAAMLTDTAPVTVSNTGSAPLSYSLTATGGSAALGNQVTLQVWKAGATCDVSTVVPSTATTGNLTTPPALPADANSAAPGAGLSLCFRSSVTGTYSAAGGLSTTPTVAVVGTVGTNWSASASASFTQTAGFNWYEIQHDFSAKCVDANGGSTAAGTNLILFPCKPLAVNTNQSYRFSQVGTTAFYRIYIGTGSSAGPVWEAASAIAGSAVQLNTIDTGTTTKSNNQQWSVVQHGDAGDFRIVNKNSSLCLTMTASTDNTVFTVTACGTSLVNTNTTYRAQHFGFVEIPS